MNDKIEFEIGKGYIVESPSFICSAYIVYKHSGWNSAVGLYLKTRKDGSDKGSIRFAGIPMNIDWSNRQEVSLVQVKAVMSQCDCLNFSIGGPYSVEQTFTSEMIELLAKFYAA